MISRPWTSRVLSATATRWTAGVWAGCTRLPRQESDRQAETRLRLASLACSGLLSDVAQIHFKPEDRAEPYGPQFVMDGRRSIIPADIRGNQSNVLSELVPAVRNPGLRVRLADNSWHNDRKLAVNAQQAIDAYCEAVQFVRKRCARSTVDISASG